MQINRSGKIPYWMWDYSVEWYKDEHQYFSAELFMHCSKQSAHNQQYDLNLSQSQKTVIEQENFFLSAFITYNTN